MRRSFWERGLCRYSWRNRSTFSGELVKSSSSCSLLDKRIPPRPTLQTRPHQDFTHHTPCQITLPLQKGRPPPGRSAAHPLNTQRAEPLMAGLSQRWTITNTAYGVFAKQSLDCKCLCTQHSEEATSLQMTHSPNMWKDSGSIWLASPAFPLSLSPFLPGSSPGYSGRKHAWSSSLSSQRVSLNWRGLLCHLLLTLSACYCRYC